MSRDALNTIPRGAAASACFLAAAAVAGPVGCPWPQIEQFRAQDAAINDQLGFSLAVNGSLAVSGAWLADPGGSNSGAVCLFDARSGRQLFKLAPADGQAGDNFGLSVAIDGDLIVAGAPCDDNLQSDIGSAYVFNALTGEQLFKFVPPVFGNALDLFGYSVAISGTIALVGAPRDTAWGTAYVLDAATGQQIKKIYGPTMGPQLAQFGWSVALSGDTAIISRVPFTFFGAPGDVFILRRDQGGPNNWGEVIHFGPQDSQIEDEFGYSVAIDGDTVVAGARRHDLPGLADAGAAYVFQRDHGGPDNWGQVRKLTAPVPSALGYVGESVSISGDLIVVGGRYDDQQAFEAGAAYVFGRHQGGPDNWGLVAVLTASDPASLDNFGNAVSIDGGLIAVGAVFKDGDAGPNTGAVYIFDSECPMCAADLDGSGVVDVTDLVALVVAWGSCDGCSQDLDGDGGVGVADLVSIILAWGPCP